MNVALKAKRIKNVYYFVLAAAIAQQLYIPVEYKYFHLPLLFLTLITADVYNFDCRDYANEYKILFLIGCSTLAAVADGLSVMDFKVLYYMLMSAAMYFVVKLIYDTVKVFSMGGKGKKYINDRNVKLFKSNGMFMRGYGMFLIAIIVLAFVYMIYDLLILG
jgi:hypothetical protein